jgi:NTE family protein
LLKKIREKLGIILNNKDSKSKRLGYYEVLNASLNMMQERLSELILEKHVPDILVKIPKTACKTFEFYRTNEMIEAGRDEFLKSYENWKANSSLNT